MTYKYMLFEVKENIALVTFNRPEALNALSPEVVLEFADILDRIKADPAVAVAVVTGAGDKAFVAGADIKVMMEHNPLEARTFSSLGQDTILKIEALPMPVLAAVNGFCLGGGCEIALGCDFIYASEKAKFGQPEINLGIIPGFGGTQRLARLVGRNRAKEMCLTGEMIDAKTAKEIGLVNKVFPPESLMEEVMKTARAIAGKSRLAVRTIKELIDRGVQIELRSALLMEVQAFSVIRAGVDSQEGLTAFVEKRKPEFKGTYDL
ncbi:MAG: enoyl-CoA hydratase-related protein [Thermodesulfobacteriota bacterium]